MQTPDCLTAAILDRTAMANAAEAHGPRDQRPLIDIAWAAANPERWQELWRNTPAECPICSLEAARVVMDGPLNSDVPTRCTHWACDGCWDRLAFRGDFHCPFCRDCLAAWHRWRRHDDDEADEEPDQALTVQSEVYLRFREPEGARTIRLQRLFRISGNTVFFGVVLHPPELRGRSLAFSQHRMTDVEELRRDDLVAEELAGLRLPRDRRRGAPARRPRR